jgi:opacity protein-like surface antigen
MKTNKVLLAVMLCVVFSTLFASPVAAGEDDFVRVTVRFARLRALPDANARIVREIGFGTMLRVLEKSGDYLRVALLSPPPSAGGEPWYVLGSDVEAVTAAAAEVLVETRRVVFSPLAPAAGQPLLFSAVNFRTPNLLKWDMGDGTVLTSGGKVSRGEEATMAYAYAAAGQYLVKVFDEGGKEGLPPVTVQVTVSALARSLSISPERPMANHPVSITARNFRDPDKIAWDLGDGSEIAPGPGPGVVKPTSLVSHAYEKAGTYVVKAYDSGDRSQPPLAAEVQVGADPRRLSMGTDRPAAGAKLEFNAVNFNTPDRLRWDMGDGTVIPAEKEGQILAGARISYRYAQPGTYTVKVYDWGGDTSRRPVQLGVVVGEPDRVAGQPARLRPVVEVSEPPATARPQPSRKKYNLLKFGPYAGYFQPQEALFKQIYGKGDVLYGARLGVHIWKGFHCLLSASQYKVIAKTTYTGDKTTLTLLPMSFFMRYNLGRGFFSPYAGIGLTLLSVKEETEFVGNFKGSGSGPSLEAGFELRVNRHFFIDFGVRFDQVKVKSEDVDGEIDLGGLQSGISLLVSF